MYEKSILDNGLRVVTHKMANMSSAAIGVWIGVGGRYEEKVNKGIAHLIEHLCFKGTKKYSGNKIKETIEGLGGSLNAFTSEEFTCYLTKIIVKHMGLALDILSDMVLEPLFRLPDLEKEKTVILEEIKMYRDLPQAYVNELLDELLWPNHPLGMNLAGTLESVSKINHHQLLDFHHKFYHPSNIVLCITGNIEHREIFNKISNIFSKAKQKPSLSFQKAEIGRRKTGTKFFYKETEQSHLAIGYLAYRRNHPDKHAVSLLHIILGANMSSRLFDKLREKKGLAYEIGTQPRYLYDTGAFNIHAGVDNQKVIPAVNAILEEVNKIAKLPVSAKEFSRAREYYTGQLLMSLEDTFDHMLWAGEQEIALRKIKSAQEILSEINKVSIDDLLRVAGDIFSHHNLNLAMVGPLSSKDETRIINCLK